MSKTVNSSKVKQKYIQKVIKLEKEGRFEIAKKEALKLLSMEVDNIIVLRLLAILSSSLDELDAEKEYLLKLLSINTTDSTIYNDLGNFYKKIDNYVKAKEMYIRAIELDSSNSLFYGNLALIYDGEKDYDSAKETYKKGINLHTNNKTFLVNYAMFLLKTNDYLNGFDLFRYRYDKEKDEKQTNLLAPEGLLKKGMDIKDKVIFITDEQGAGDIVQFMRYLGMFRSQGAKVYLHPRNLLRRLIQKNYPEIDFAQGQINIDYHIPLVDSAYFFATEYDTIPFQDKYLSVDKNDSKIIHNKYFQNVMKKKVGIVWRSNAGKNESLSKQKERNSRNCTLEDFLFYFNIPEVQLYSLQVAVNDDEQILLDKHNILSLGDSFVDLYDNALVIDNLDLLIGIDTLSILLSGAMGKETVVLLTYNADWRWGIEAGTTNWFQSIKLIRQEKRNDWVEVFEKVSQLDGVLCEINPVTLDMKLAIENHQKGDLQKAKNLYLKVLTIDPNNADACHYLGVITYQTGHINTAIGLIDKAIILNPKLAEAHKNLQNILLSSSDFFTQNYLNLRIKKFDIQKFSVRSINHQLTVDEKRLVNSMKLTIDSLETDPFLKSVIALYLELLADNFEEGLITYLNNEIGISFQLEKLGLLYKIAMLQGFEFTLDELQLIKEKFDTLLDADSFETFSVEEKINLLNVFFQFYKLFSESFKITYESYVLPILKNFIKYNYLAKVVLDNKKDINGLKTFIYVTSLYNPLFLDPVCKPYVFSEVQQLFKTVVLLKDKYFEQFDYLSKNLLMHWYTTLRDGIDDTFVNTKYVLLINDTSDHYHPGCYMTSMGIKQMLLLNYDEIIDIPIHEIYSNGEMFDLTTADKFDDPSIYSLFQEKLPLMDQKLSNAQEVIINGEGTLHNRRPHVIFLLYLAYIAKTKYHKRVSIVNHSPYPSYIQVNRDVIADEIYKKVYEKLDFIGIREPRAKALMDELNITSKLTFDCSSIYLNKLDQKLLLNVTPYNNYIVFSASVVANNNTTEVFREIITQLTQEGKKIVLFNGGPYEEKIFLENLYKYFENNKKVTFIETKSIEHFLSVLKHATMLVSGRFHYSIVSLFLQRPFILLNSNTSKNLGLLEMLHLPNKVFGFDSKDLKNELLEEVRKIREEPEKYILQSVELENLEKLARDNIVFE